MKKGLKIDFTSTGGPRLATTEKRTGVDCSVQNALVNVATSRGSDPIYADRGTQLLQRALYGIFSTEDVIQHECNFAAVDSLFFVREHDRLTDADERINDIFLIPGDAGEWYDRRLPVRVTIETTSGREIGQQLVTF